MKELFFAAYQLDVGGIETALVTLLNMLCSKGYKITLGLEKKQGIFLNDLDSRIKVIEYKPSGNKIGLIRKIVNFAKRINFILKYYNKFDFSACFATYSLPAGFMARTASKNSNMWVHADYLKFFYDDVEKLRKYFIELKQSKYKHIIFVSNEAKNSFLKAFPMEESRLIVCNNAINYNAIKVKAEEPIDEKRDTRVITFLNIGRQEERQKRLTRLIEASLMLKKDGEKFRVLLIGDGPDTGYYKELVNDNGLTDELIFLGRKKNPYPYFKISDCTVLTSDYEGFPVVFIESLVMGLPILTTDISDSKEEIEGKYGYVCSKDVKEIYQMMKRFIHDGYIVKNKFRPDEFNDEIMKKLEEVF